MPDRSLILPGGAVRAVLREVEAPGSGKSQHRVKLEPYDPPYSKRHSTRPIPADVARFLSGGVWSPGFLVPFAVGDRIWVRETWGVGTRPSPFLGWRDGVEYRADASGDDPLPLHHVKPPDGVNLEELPGGWRSSATMPRWASRLSLVVTDVRVQRVQDISEEDARAEGVAFEVAVCRGADDDLRNEPSYRGGFANRWAEQHGPDAWARNDWVVASTFRLHARNIDMEADNG